VPASRTQSSFLLFDHFAFFSWAGRREDLMSDETPSDQARPEGLPERRFMLRYPSQSGAVVIRETDMMRTGIEARLKDVTSAGVGVIVQTPLAVNEPVRLVLRNEVQKIEKETRGIVRHVTPVGEDSYHVGIELAIRLTPLEASLLKMGLSSDSKGDDATWG
jgi:hypothetical protein